jgi:UDP-N-acetylmuramate--alanine ligase
VKHIHIVGIGGAGLSALAQVMLARGFTISGSDPQPNRLTDALATAGATIYSEHTAANISGADQVVITSAVRGDNPEVVAAHLQKIPVLKRREFLHEVTLGYDIIAVAGSHGKTTTTAMLALVMAEAGIDPTVVVGGTLPPWGTNARAGSSRWFVIEADEYDLAFLGLEPWVTVLTNVDYDHPDLFPTHESYQNAFEMFVKQTRRGGVVIVCGDDPTALRIARASGRTVIRYGTGHENEWQISQFERNEDGETRFVLHESGRRVGSIVLRVPGEHNVLNAVAVVAAAEQAGVEFETAKRSLEEFEGVERRFQVRGTYNGAVVIDDYAHHPTEIRATLRAARQRYPTARIWAMFQPHTYSRTQALAAEFADAFGDADRVVISEIYAAREQNTAGASALELVKRMDQAKVVFVAGLEEGTKYLRRNVRPGDVVMTLGAGNVNRVADKLSENSNA